MGVKNLMKQIPQIKLCDVFSHFAGCEFIIDCAHLMIRCAFRESATFVINNYIPALKLFQQQILYMKSREVKYYMVFDGCTRLEKEPENLRRQETREKAHAKLLEKKANNENFTSTDFRGLVSNTSLYIAMCVKVCKQNSIPFAVARFEADSQVV